MPGSLFSIGEPRLCVEQRGRGDRRIARHGGTGLDHRMFGDYLDRRIDFEHSVLMTLVEENERDLGVVRSFFDRRTVDGSRTA